MTFRQRVLIAGVFASLALAAAPTAGAVEIVDASQMVPGSSPAATQNGRVKPQNLGGSGCGLLGVAPEHVDAGTNFQLTNHTFRSRLTNPVCITASLTTACAGVNSIFSVGYIGSFNPGNPLENYAGDIGSTGSGSYAISVPAGSAFSIVVHETNAGQGCLAYDLKVESDGPWANAAPAIAGDAAAVGNTITGNDAAWAMGPPAPAIERQWRRCDSAGANCTAIPGATGGTYTVTSDDLGHTLRFRNAATDTDGTSTSDSGFVEPFIPFEARNAESLGAGDRVHNGIFVRDGIDSHCGAPKSTPATLQAVANFLYEPFTVQSLLNEPVCLVARTAPVAGCGPGVTPSIYNPGFVPTGGIGQNYAANSGTAFTSVGLASTSLPPGDGREVVVSLGSPVGSCGQYSLILGADAPFATARPSIGGDAAEGGTLTANDGTWSGAPALARSWRRCDAAGGNCTPIEGANGATHSPTAADVGSRLRVRVTATQGRTVSSDSEPSAVVAAAPGGGDGGGGTAGTPPDLTAPKGTLRLGSRDLAKAVKTGRVPIRVTCDEACSAVVELRVTSKVAKRLGLKKNVVIAKTKGNLEAGKAKTLRAKLTSRARRPLRRRKALSFRIAGAFTDSSGNAAKLSAKVSLKRPRKR